MEKLTLRRLAEVVAGRLHDEAAADRLVGPDVVIDSREATPGALFVAFAGEQVDGHDYIAKAAGLGAVATLCQRVPAELAQEVAAGCVIVADQTAALGKLARHLTERPGLAVIGITGSQGKTSTKDLVAQVLSGHGETVAPQGSFNNEIGVPLTATRVNDSTRFLVSEMGARGVGHISYLCSLTPPSIGVVLNVGQAHVGEFGSQDVIAEAKGELVEALPAEGWAVLNGTDRRVVAMASRTPARVALFSGGGDPMHRPIWSRGPTRSPPTISTAIPSFSGSSVRERSRSPPRSPSSWSVVTMWATPPPPLRRPSAPAWNCPRSQRRCRPPSPNPAGGWRSRSVPTG